MPGPAVEVARGTLEMLGPEGSVLRVAFRPENRNFSMSCPRDQGSGRWRVDVVVDPEGRPGTFSGRVSGEGIPPGAFARSFGAYGELYEHGGHVVRYRVTD